VRLILIVSLSAGGCPDEHFAPPPASASGALGVPGVSRMSEPARAAPPLFISITAPSCGKAVPRVSRPGASVPRFRAGAPRVPQLLPAGEDGRDGAGGTNPSR